MFVHDLENWGLHGCDVILKSDDEASIVALKKAMAMASCREARTKLEESPVGESQANGQIERMIRTLKEQIIIQRSFCEQSRNRDLTRA